jgi:hypothetical protein
MNSKTQGLIIVPLCQRLVSLIFSCSPKPPPQGVSVFPVCMAYP